MGDHSRVRSRGLSGASWRMAARWDIWRRTRALRGAQLSQGWSVALSILPTLQKKQGSQRTQPWGGALAPTWPPLAGGSEGSATFPWLSTAVCENVCFRHKKTIPMFVPESVSKLQKFTR